jgi:hypothetical protein
MDFSTKDATIYVDGSPMSFSYEGVPANWDSLTSPSEWLWGGNPDRSLRYFDGMFDEIRVSDVVRSQDWLNTSINNQSDPASFISVGALESQVVITENSPNGTIVTSAIARDPDAGDTLTYTITSGNTDGAFAINSVNGEITVANQAALDFETNPTFSLAVHVEDTGGLSDTALIVVNLGNVFDEAPLIIDGSTSIDEDITDGTPVYNVDDDNTGTDNDADGQAITYTIASGNEDGNFAIDSGSGQISVAANASLDYETLNQYVLTIEASDGTNTDTADITIDINNVNDVNNDNENTSGQNGSGDGGADGDGFDDVFIDTPGTLDINPPAAIEPPETAGGALDGTNDISLTLDDNVLVTLDEPADDGLENLEFPPADEPAREEDEEAAEKAPLQASSTTTHYDEIVDPNQSSKNPSEHEAIVSQLTKVAQHIRESAPNGFREFDNIAIRIDDFAQAAPLMPP